MKKFLLLFVSIALLTSCENSETLPVNDENNLVQKINQSAKTFQKKSETYSTYGNKKPIDRNKAIKLGIADAIGGLISSGAGPYGTLWGGFLSTLTVEPYLRTSKKISSENEEIELPVDNNELFIYGHFGKNHNVLMKNAIDNNIKANIINNSLESELRNYMLSNNFYDEEDISLAFIQNENNLVNIISKANENSVMDNFNHENFMNSFRLNAFQKEIVNTINGNLNTIEDSNISAYLLSVQNIISNDNTLTPEDKKSILIYIAILNSSTMLWLNN